MRRLGLDPLPCLLEALADAEQVARQVVSADVDAEALDHAVAFDDGAARFPKRAALPRTNLALTSSEDAEPAGLGLDLVHGSSVEPARLRDIGPPPDSVAAFY